MTFPVMLALWMMQMILYVPGRSNFRVWLSLTFAPLWNARPGTLRSWAASPLQEKVTVPPGAIFTWLGDHRYNAVPATPTAAESGLPLEGCGVDVGCGPWVGGGALLPPVVGVGGGGLEVAETGAEGLARALVGLAVAEAAAVAPTAGVEVATITAGAAFAPAPEVELPPQALKPASAPEASKIQSGRRIVLPRCFVVPVFRARAGSGCERAHEKSGHRFRDGHS